jgi:hypothetical protein
LSVLTTIVGFVTPEEEKALDAATAIATAGMTASR